MLHFLKIKVILTFNILTFLKFKTKKIFFLFLFLH